MICKRPPLARIAHEDDVIAELVASTPARGMRKALAYDAHISPSHLSKIVHRTKPVTPRLAKVLGFQLTWVRTK